MIRTIMVSDSSVSAPDEALGDNDDLEIKKKLVLRKPQLEKYNRNR